MKFIALVVALLSSAVTSIAQAEDWPARPVRIIAPFAPGGTADTLGRVAAEQLSEVFQQHFFVENRPGAGGVTASLAVARMEPDGYNFVVSGIATHAIAPVINPNTGYDPVNDFTHVAYFGGPPIVFIVPVGLGVKSLAELVAYAQESQRETDLCIARHRHQRPFGGGVFRPESGITIEHIPYRGAAPGVMDVVAGHLRFGSMTWTTAAGQIAAGTVVPLAVSAPQRLADFPTIPTFKEYGYPDLVSTTWFALAGPARLPDGHRGEDQPARSSRHWPSPTCRSG